MRKTFSPIKNLPEIFSGRFFIYSYRENKITV